MQYFENPFSLSEKWFFFVSGSQTIADELQNVHLPRIKHVILYLTALDIKWTFYIILFYIQSNR